MAIPTQGDGTLGLAVELLALSRSPGLCLDDFLARARSDRTLGERIVGVANAPLYGLPDCIRDMERATFALGPRTVARIAVGLGAADLLARVKRLGLFAHCLDVATSGEALAETLGLSAVATDLHAAGWLHVFEPTPEWPGAIRDAVCSWSHEDDGAPPNGDVRTLLRAAHLAQDGPERLAPFWSALGLRCDDVEFALASAQSRAKQLATLLR